LSEPGLSRREQRPKTPLKPVGAADKEGRRTRFMQALQNMKTLAEGRKLN
jgi:hypothetical protein